MITLAEDDLRAEEDVPLADARRKGEEFFFSFSALAARCDEVKTLEHEDLGR